jgi:ribose transport system permease protein
MRAAIGRLRVPVPAPSTVPVFVVLGILLVWLAFVGPAYDEPSGYIALLKRSAPLIILAVGQYFVIVSGGFDLSVGSLVTAEVVVAARLLDGRDELTWPVIALLLLGGAFVGLVNGLISTVLAVPSFITTLGMLLVLEGAVFLWTGGAPRGALTEGFRMLGREAIEDVPGIGLLPYSVLVLIAVVALAAWLMRTGTGRTLLAVGDNDDAVLLAGGRVRTLRTGAFVLSGLLASVAAILLGGFSGVSAQVGVGLEFKAITAVVLGGVVLGGGRGSVVAAAAGALTLQALFSLMNLLGVSGALESTVQGLIIIAAVAYASASARLAGRFRRDRRHPGPPGTDAPEAAPTTPTASTAAPTPAAADTTTTVGEPSGPPLEKEHR